MTGVGECVCVCLGGGGEGRREYQAYLGFGFYKNDLFLGFQINLKFFRSIGIMYD